ncbi:hypothetical protein DQ239_01230 [Blastococcus sp. TF02-09]|uniref:hypothetical protein n=1 Tax=Blastococcus sp. TF02-09 TaxID=2250576 RepID=UPI000DE98094|nr:hypothetical protein [Blastococcus sp. TF02-9]RBY81266.1 hypothetical protein DQ239_01230 [Blastococcus sp. TF02-9]
MSTDSDTPRPTRSDKARAKPDPLQMTAAEKCMAEWEARHDVRARGHRGDPEAVQHYIAAARSRVPNRPH